MEDLAVLNLMDCPLCMEPLDVSAKVLPCQHTFCLSCLHHREAASPDQMYCPECRTAVLGSVDQLPNNLLLVRLLQTLQEQGLLGTPRDRSVRYVGTTPQDESLSINNPDIPKQMEDGQGVQAKALYDFQGTSPGELTIKAGDIIYMRWKVDDNWYYGEANDASGLVPVNVVQVISKQPQPPALCRALYDFNANNNLHPEDCKECLTFSKGDSITLVKQLNQNWVEGKLGDKLGIFPLQLTEPNLAAHELLERNRRNSLESHPRSATRVSADANVHRRLTGASYKSVRPPNVSFLNSLNRPPLGHSQQPPHISSTTHTSSSRTPRLTTLNRPRLRSSRRNSLKRTRTMSGESPPTIAMALINPAASSVPAESKVSSTQQLSISVCAALYSYTPHRSEELELRMGEMVGVYGKFKEGWLRGLSLRTGKVGILPANYVTPVLRTSARFVEQTKPVTLQPNVSTAPTKRHTPHKPQPVVAGPDKVNTDISPTTMAVMSPAVPGRAPRHRGKQGWNTLRRALNASHRGFSHHGNNSNAPLNLQPPPQDLGQIYSFGRSPVLPKKRNSLFSNATKGHHWAYETTAPPGGFLTGFRDSAQKDATAIPQSILVKPDAYRHNTEKPVKSVRFQTHDAPQITSKITAMPSTPSSGQLIGPQSGISSLDHWNPSAILGRDGSTLVLKDTKTSVPRKPVGQDPGGTMDNFALNLKPVLINSHSGFNRHRVMKGYNAKTDAELTLTEGEIVIIQRPRPDGRILMTQEISGKTGLFHSSILDVLDKVY